MNFTLGIISIIGGIVLIIRILLKPHEKSPWLLNARGLFLGVLLVILGVMLITGET